MDETDVLVDVRKATTVVRATLARANSEIETPGRTEVSNMNGIMSVIDLDEHMYWLK